jgi:hypothetical protein
MMKMGSRRHKRQNNNEMIDDSTFRKSFSKNKDAVIQDATAKVCDA